MSDAMTCFEAVCGAKEVLVLVMWLCLASSSDILKIK